MLRDSIRTAFLVTVPLFVLGCGAAIHVTSERLAPPSGAATTYAIVQASDAPARDRDVLLGALREELANRGWRAASPERADVVLRGNVSYATRVEIDTFAWTGRHLHASTTVERDYRVRTLHVRAVGVSNAVVWRGELSSDHADELTEDQLREAVRELLSTFPYAAVGDQRARE